MSYLRQPYPTTIDGRSRPSQRFHKSIVITKNSLALITISAINEFTKRLFDKVNTDEQGIIPMLAPNKLNFRDASDAFNLISPTIPVLVCPQHHQDTFDRALSHRDWSTLDRFSVGFYPNEVPLLR